MLAGTRTPSGRHDPLGAVRALAESAANQRGSSFVGSNLRLFADHKWVDAQESPGHVSPFDLGRSYELLLAPKARRKKGAHLTPERIARRLVDMMPPPLASDRVLDPAVGGASFLLAAADQLVAHGAIANDVLDQLFGVDIDPGAVEVAEAALAVWTLDQGLSPRLLPNLSVGDGLLDALPTVERVVGNPPFLNQLRSSSRQSTDRRTRLRDRWGDLVGTYTDDAWLFLVSGLEATTRGGSLAMVQPVSILAARHGSEIRHHAQSKAALTGLWVAGEQVFDAAVQVCGLVLERQELPSGPVKRCVGADFLSVPALTLQPSPKEWGSAAATALDVPNVRIAAAATGTVADLANATAGFRDQFYGFVPYVSEGQAEAIEDAEAPLVTVGMIDVLGVSWGQREFKFAKQGYSRPVIDVDALSAQDPNLGEWVKARRRPKLLIASQTRVVEVWVDERGHAIPATPVLSIEPESADPQVLWMLAAALTAPAMSAHFLGSKFGTAMSLNAMKIAARERVGCSAPLGRSRLG